MKSLSRPGTLFALLLGSAAAALAAYAVAAPDEEDYVDVCVGKDRILRLLESGPCAAGERRLKVSLWQPEEPDEDDDDDDADEGSPEKPVTKAPPAGNRFVAPFEVVDGAGQTILYVTEGGGDGRTRGAYIYTSSEQPVVAITTPGNSGGLVRVSQAESIDTRVSIGALGGSLGLLVSREDQTQAYVGRNEYGGVVQVFSSGDKPRTALLTEPDGRGSVVVFSGSGTPIASIAESDKVTGTGRLTAADPSGNGVFSAGWTPDTGGNACVIRKGRLWCVGVNIPLGIGANPGQ